MTILENILNKVSARKGFYISSGVSVTGTLTADVPGTIAGTINGDVLVNGKLVLLKNSLISGNVKAESLEILGRVTGDIHCSGKIILQNDSFVKGNITTGEIHIEKNAVVDGIITKSGNKIEDELQTDSGEEILEEKMDEPVLDKVEIVAVKIEEEVVESWF